MAVGAVHGVNIVSGIRDELNIILDRLANLEPGLMQLEVARQGKRCTRHDDAMPDALISSSKAIYKLRRFRDELFGPDLFGEPSWDILLDLYMAHHSNRKISVTSACIAACVPPTTGLRWISILVEKGLLVRTQDPEDGRRHYLTLSDETVEKLGELFSRMPI